MRGEEMSSARILIVEDEGIEALDMQYRLKCLGYPTSVVVATGEEAVSAAGEKCPDLVLMDIMLQGEIDGVTAAEQIRALCDIPVIYVTAYADEATLQRVKITEPHGYIVKPFHDRELHIAIDMALYKHKMEKKLKENEKWLATTLKSIGDAVIATDSHGMITFMNPVAEGLTGWKLAEAANKKFSEIFRIINRDKRNPVDNPVERVLAEGVTVGMANHTLLVSRKGNEIPIDDSAAPIRADDGSMMGVILVFRDITAREQAENAVLRAKEYWERTFDATPDLIAIIDTTFHIVQANKAMTERLGLTEQSCLGQICYKAVHGTDSPPDFCPHLQTLTDRLEHTAEVSEERLCGDFLVSTSPLYEPDGKMIGSVHVARDITSRKQAERSQSEHAAQLEKINKELESFSYSVSHDLRAPLRAIDGYARIIMRRQADRFDEDTRERFNVIRKNVEMMGKLIDDLLALSRLGRQSLSKTILDMSKVIDDVWKEQQVINPGRNMTLTIKQMTPGNGDRSLIKQVYANLLANAVKFTKNCDMACIEAGGSISENEHVYYIRDNGAGFDMAYYDKLFGVFQRLHSSMEFEGTGVGLATVQRIIHRHGGRVWAEGKVGEGATFYFSLPENSNTIG
jgi:PAS domain S-box-containing protein